jgi:hypothetical protein
MDRRQVTFRYIVNHVNELCYANTGKCIIQMVDDIKYVYLMIVNS